MEDLEMTKERKKRSERQELKVRSAREMTVAKRNDMVQKGRINLTLQEQKSVLYTISKIKPGDTAFTEYVFEIKDFYDLCGIQNESYNELKSILLTLKQKSWWMEIDDEGTESAVSWFNTVRTNKKSGKVTIKFHEDMMPFLLQLVEQDTFYTSYNLKFVLPMKSQYGPRLYEILKSYKSNNRSWFFETDELKRLLNAQKYDRWPDFRRRVLEPAIEDINKYSDIKVAFDTQREGRKVTRVNFFMVNKTEAALLETERLIEEELDGQINMDELIEERRNSVEAKFFRDNPVL